MTKRKYSEINPEINPEIIKNVSCAITFEEITKDKGLLIKVENNNCYSLYFINDEDTLRKLKSCPFTRKDSYEYIPLSELTSEQFERLNGFKGDESKSNNTWLFEKSRDFCFKSSEFNKSQEDDNNGGESDLIDLDELLMYAYAFHDDDELTRTGPASSNSSPS